MARASDRLRGAGPTRRTAWRLSAGCSRRNSAIASTPSCSLRGWMSGPSSASWTSCWSRWSAARAEGRGAARRGRCAPVDRKARLRPKMGARPMARVIQEHIKRSARRRIAVRAPREGRPRVRQHGPGRAASEDRDPLGGRARTARVSKAEGARDRVIVRKRTAALSAFRTIPDTLTLSAR